MAARVGSCVRAAHVLTERGVQDSDGMTLLHWACDRGLADLAGYLLEHGANVNAQVWTSTRPTRCQCCS